MIDLKEVLQIHDILINEFGGLNGVRDMDLLKSAIERPFTGYGDTEHYETIEEKSAAIIESIIQNHPFVDGNKRTGFVIMRLLLLEFGKDIIATQGDKYDLVISIASGDLKYKEILSWIKAHIK